MMFVRYRKSTAAQDRVQRAQNRQIVCTRITKRHSPKFNIGGNTSLSVNTMNTLCEKRQPMTRWRLPWEALQQARVLNAFEHLQVIEL